MWDADTEVFPYVYFDGGRWMVGAGREPAEPPSVWPDTDTAVRAGYRDLRRG